MGRTLGLVLAVVAIAAFFVSSVVGSGEASHDAQFGAQLADISAQLPHEPDGDHGGFPHQGMLHCPSFQCAPASLILPVAAPQRRDFDPSVAFRPILADKALRSVFLERDPPIPRFSS